MAVVSDIRPNAGFAASIVETVKSLGERYAKYRLYRTTLNELRALSSRELADIGLHRSMLNRIALEGAYGKQI